MVMGILYDLRDYGYTARVVPLHFLHLNWSTNIIPFYYYYIVNTLLLFISSCYGDSYAMVVLMVAYHHHIWILHYSLLVARYQNNIIPSCYTLGTSSK